MPSYTYTAKTAEGKTLRGELDAENKKGAAQYIMGIGATPVKLHEKTDKTGASTDVGRLYRNFTNQGVPLADLVIFARHFRSLLHAGVPIVRGLRELAENGENEDLSEALNAVANDLEGGGSLSDSMSRHPRVFPKLFIHMMRVGERSGQIEDALGQMAENLEQERTTRARIKSAMRYPMFVMIAIVGAIVVVNVFVVPTFAELFASFDAELPTMTKVLMAVSDFTRNKGHWLIAGAIGGVFAIRRYLGTTQGRYKWDRTKLKLPIVGKVMQRALLARFTRTFAMALRAGVPLLTAIETVADATNNAYVSDGIRGLSGSIEQGLSLHEACKRSELFTPMVLQMLAVGEETGQLAQLMDQVADFYEGEVEEDLERLPSYLEPILIGFIGAIVLVLALGIFMPIWTMSSAIQ